MPAYHELTPAQKARRRRKKRKETLKVLGALALALLIVILGIVFAIRGIIHLFTRDRHKAQQTTSAEVVTIDDVIAEADRLAEGYDCDAAIEKIKSYSENYQYNNKLNDAVERYEAKKETLVPFTDIDSITHIFFHTLIVDCSLAFNVEDKNQAAGYNQYMTTVSEFKKMMEQMYERGYVLVDLHQIASIQTDENGNEKMVPTPIMLPEGKKPFVMSQDDVCYYYYMDGAGFATKIVIGEDGMPTCEYKNPDGTVVTGDYDLVPILEHFIDEHPDFSYRGARAALAFTGYDGVLGYRTSPSSDSCTNDYSEEEVEKAKAVAERLKECGWTLASHSWGHQRYGAIEYEKMVEDADKWEKEVEPIIGECDTIIYANGNDIAGVEDYDGNPKYEYLKGLGFRYFCNVDSSRYWVQLGGDYLRQGRRNFDGYRMYYNPEMLEDCIDVSEVWDKERPAEVPPI
ncbi:MAG: polysaccharide deacetylase [Clostridia bacterium]|nr:polysaccharide deacetylase [Clostridia bacterium]